MQLGLPGLLPVFVTVMNTEASAGSITVTLSMDALYVVAPRFAMTTSTVTNAHTQRKATMTIANDG